MSWITRAALKRDASSTRNLTRLLVEGAQGDVGHTLVWSLFDDSEATRDFLYREIEPGRFMIVSKRPPTDAHQLWRLETKPYAPSLSIGQRLGFSLRANPAKHTRAIRDVRGRGKRVDAVMHAKYAARLAGKTFSREDEIAAALDWLASRSERLGLRLDPALCSATTYEARRVSKPGRPAATFQVVDYDGVGIVEQADLLTGALLSGVGAAKAYGCGLLLIRPAPASTAP